MAGISSKIIPLVTKAPDFSLPDAISGKTFSLEDLASDFATVIFFISNNCPYVNHIINGLVKTAKDFISQGIKFAAVNSNDYENYPDESPDKMRKFARFMDFSFHYLVDKNQELAKSMKAVCTPDIFVYNKDLLLVYHGQYDDSRPGNTLKTNGLDLHITLKNLLCNLPVDTLQKQSHGTPIKWKIFLKQNN